MKEHEPLGPMDDELRTLLRRGAAPNEAAAGAEERLFARLLTSLPIVPGPGGGGGQGGTGAPGAAGAAGASGTVAISKVVALVAAAIAFGGAAGAAITSVAIGDRVRVVYVDRPVDPASPTVATAEPSAAVSAARIEDLPSAASTARAGSPPPSAPSPSTSPLNAERALLDRARAAFAQGDNASALATLDNHRRLYPNGSLNEEREALAVRTLASAGRLEEARERGRRFVARYPGSLMLPVVEDAMGNGRDR